MTVIDVLEREIRHKCEINNIEFEWIRDVRFGYYILQLRKSDKKYNIIVSERDLCVKPIALIHTEIENGIFNLIEETDPTIFTQPIMKRSGKHGRKKRSRKPKYTD